MCNFNNVQLFRLLSLPLPLILTKARLDMKMSLSVKKLHVNSQRDNPNL